ncbi:hypothetical protein [Pelagicoccus sp. SDUM812005]|uniref:hypothetical protein n=1 Tax=Pelagicoccus sp. SDUM812005 TaxID=3041257 RepID=UPI00280CA278|nr:hypothetical protein [Pelagicoccus sp. SDUM812005]MDQ8179378.1 hypothetical protein [Pelagicoccus sp. SDUM812005]
MIISPTNDGSKSAPRLEVFFNMWTFQDLPDHCTAPRGAPHELYAAIRDAGFSGVQDGNAAAAKAAGLMLTAGARVNHPTEIKPLVEKHLAEGQLATTLHCGWGMEDDHQVDAYATAVLETSREFNYPLFIETHRATITQDNWRTVQLVKRFPELRFNGDFSHWYAGLEMVNGHWDEKVDFIRPVLERVGFMHGRIATPGAIQAPVTGELESTYVQHFRELWRLCFEGFLKRAGPGDFLVFAPELLWPAIYYAPTLRNESGGVSEIGDRWEDALLIRDIALEEFAQAQDSTTV